MEHKENGDVYLNTLFGDLWIVQDDMLYKINDGWSEEIDVVDGFVYVGHLDVTSNFYDK